MLNVRLYKPKTVTINLQGRFRQSCMNSLALKETQFFLYWYFFLSSAGTIQNWRMEKYNDLNQNPGY